MNGPRETVTGIARLINWTPSENISIAFFFVNALASSWRGVAWYAIGASNKYSQYDENAKEPLDIVLVTASCIDITRADTSCVLF